MRILAMVLVGGCGVKAVCNAKHGQDCCTSNAYCERSYGKEFPYCVDPGNDGTCSECAHDGDCDEGQHCEIEDSFGVCQED